MSFDTIMTGLERPVSFYFIRHGESEGNARGIVQGREDALLTDRGRTQAVRAGQWLKSLKVNPDAVRTSPLQRAGETARIITGLTPDDARYGVITELQELDTGIFSGYSLQEAQEKMPRDYQEFTARSWDSVPGAEGRVALTDRALRVWQILAETANALPADPSLESSESSRNAEEPGRATVLCVTHGGLIQWLLKTSFGATREAPREWMPLIKVSNCGVFQIDLRPVRTVDRQDRPLRWFHAQWSRINETAPRDT
ncbi:probable phosphoglycerate mutase [Alkalispirochaeta americana]|uniref:Probable phosphoglycerate mutase n=1 Tax=Alkalispirochaeta americana TaxID=159291 RepID=A0A1N6S4G8_9SPIO|nr:histidine phosphatase family protein [Alkalispirochaeta americana]SIQ35971.1 probable phosphoglycerate mutase [Alkalispirochaeta americana]